MIKYDFTFSDYYKDYVQRCRWNYKGIEEYYYETNIYGDGIFFVDLRENIRIQLEGTCDFSICGLKKTSARAKIKKWMRDTGR